MMELPEDTHPPSGYQSKTQSLRDKMKKRRQAIESLLTGEMNHSQELDNLKKPVEEKRFKSERLRFLNNL